MTHNGQVLCRVLGSGLIGILTEGHIEAPVELILDDGASPEQLGLLRAEGGLARVAEAIDRGIEEGVPGLTMGELVRDVHEGEENAGGGGSDV